jgi:hypothetical protein
MGTAERACLPRAARSPGVNHPFDIAPDGQWIATSDAVHLTSAIWVLPQD